MHNSPLKIQAQSFGNYLRDIWFVALLFVLIRKETTVDLPLIWICLQLIITIVSLFIFGKTGPNRISPFVIPFLILLPLILFSSPIWLFLGSVVFSTWRLQVRFNERQEEQAMDSPFTLYYFFTFLGVHFVSFLLGHEGYQFLLYAVFLIGITLFGGVRLFAVSLYANSENTITKTKLASIYLLSMFGVFSLSALVYFLVPFFRKVVDQLFEKVIRVALIPFAPLIGYLEGFIKGLPIQEEEESIRIPVEELAEIEQKELITKEPLINFPFEWIFIGLAIVAILFVVRYLLKNKPMRLNAELQNIQYENKQIDDAEDKQITHPSSLYQVETSFLREKYIQFELEAHGYDYIRDKSETVREWFERQQWTVDSTFFQTYEEIRYGGKTISSEKANLFVENLESIKKEKFLKKDV
ncbi:hypothetical protein [Psychrobacillus lasiicapitis]|nr:hypothetical protein [Psychrobacillus lasiicapitis]GGA17680.1 hypothetical protein GCM10011384_03390 [Psychrobacillus lasiicapitis]